MPRTKLPDFSSPSTRELRAMWRTAGEQTRRLISEVVRLRELVTELDAYGGVVQKVWSEDCRGKLVALEKMRILFSDERSRMGTLTAEPPPAPPDAEKDDAAPTTK